ncbi:ribosomal protein S10 (plastid) [Cryptomonas paramecium]|uniref:Ribosomal protein S10 n=1 Tax=Cryptomonas paramaecium TaxID=2898 RepID=D2ISC2_9CRYP|nr:ribosomal protein S10 [Cryptomonas paramecium]ACT46814.1 ribosomal protein S10 [Cryptomonas paramecium]BDA97981.1 ribosomal protein S10 [Cryptomonas paramecium]
MHMNPDKLKLILKSYEISALKKSCEQIINVSYRTGCSSTGPISLPTKRRIYCVLRSPHVNKDSREHFETRTHKKVIYLHNPPAETIQSLIKLDLPPSVHLKIDT